nr:DipZ protein [Solirubrobacterales bacterium]MBA2765939.1 DipZ protein [Solirubrobacterales bacterium]
AVQGPACLPLVEHERHSAGVLDLAPGPGVTCHGVQFTPGVA